MMILADVLKWAKEYSGPKFHALLCDPPYHLVEITRRYGKAGSAPAQYGTDGAFARASKGFMGKQWDGGDLAFRPSTWAAICQHLHPGAWGFVFASSRGWHRLATAIEDAGMVIQPTIWRWTSRSGRVYMGTWDEIQALMVRERLPGALEEVTAPGVIGWAYGSGFPKATRVDSQIDAAAFRKWLRGHPSEKSALEAARQAERAARKEKRTTDAKALKTALKQLEAQLREQAGLTPRVIGQKKHQPKFAAAELGYREKDNGYNSRERESFDLTAPATEDAGRWMGHRYGGQALKPSLEPIIVFQKPYERSALECITSTGAGALWIDGGRIGAGDDRISGGTGHRENSYGGYADDCQRPTGGRWPANLVLIHHPECEPAGARRVRNTAGSIRDAGPRENQVYGADDRPRGDWQAYGDPDGMETIAAWNCHPACPVRHLGEQSGESASKASQRGQVNIGQFGGTAGAATNRNGHSTERGRDDAGTAARYFYQADWMYERLEASDPALYYPKASRAEREAGLDPRTVALMRLLDDSPDAAEFDETTVDDGREVPIDNPYQRGETTRRNTHPTIKPIALSRYLATLLLPPAEYAPRRLLIPFAGAGSEVIGAMLAGWEEITGIELESDHVAIAAARIAYWQARRWELGDPARAITVKTEKPAPVGQLDMFDLDKAA